jgi:hypothetical protein
MPTLFKFVVYFAVLAIIGIVANAIPKSEREMRLLLAFVMIAWFGGGILIIFRAIYRFITR